MLERSEVASFFDEASLLKVLLKRIEKTARWRQKWKICNKM
jgi:hypothetical protein